VTAKIAAGQAAARSRAGRRQPGAPRTHGRCGARRRWYRFRPLGRAGILRRFAPAPRLRFGPPARAPDWQRLAALAAFPGGA
jgi:hypothetical protein